MCARATASVIAADGGAAGLAPSFGSSPSNATHKTRDREAVATRHEIPMKREQGSENKSRYGTNRGAELTFWLGGADGRRTAWRRCCCCSSWRGLSKAAMKQSCWVCQRTVKRCDCNKTTNSELTANYKPETQPTQAESKSMTSARGQRHGKTTSKNKPNYSSKHKLKASHRCWRCRCCWCCCCCCWCGVFALLLCRWLQPQIQTQQTIIRCTLNPNTNENTSSTTPEELLTFCAACACARASEAADAFRKSSSACCCRMRSAYSSEQQT